MCPSRIGTILEGLILAIAHGNAIPYFAVDQLRSVGLQSPYCV